jgi:putative oxidoreductase
MHYTNGDGFGGYSHAVENAIVFIGLFIAGSGKYALKISRK